LPVADRYSYEERKTFFSNFKTAMISGRIMFTNPDDVKTANEMAATKDEDQPSSIEWWRWVLYSIGGLLGAAGAIGLAYKCCCVDRNRGPAVPQPERVRIVPLGLIIRAAGGD
jgi:hypothetical protein